MKVLVLGSNSFLSKEIKDYFADRNFFYIDRKILDLENKKNVDLFFNKNYFDVVINTCVSGGKRGVVDTFDTLASNINMFNNLLGNTKRYGKLFNFCSGAAFDRSINITKAKEEELFLRNPKDYYGMSKNIIARESYKIENIYNFRIFGCFGKHEIESRFIKNSINKIENNENIIIHKDRYIDYISAKDLCTIIDFYIKNETNLRDINLAYSEKIKLSDIAERILYFKNSQQGVTIQSSEQDLDYTADNNRLNSLKINLSGLEKSLEEIICQT